MTTSRTIKVCDAIVALLNDSARSWNGDLTAERKYEVRFDLKEIDTVKVAVVPRERERQIIAKVGGPDERVIEIDIGIFERVDATGTPRKDRLDELMELVEDIEDFFLKYDFAVEGVDVMTRGTKTEPLFDPDMLEEKSTFGSVCRLELYEAS